MKIIISPAKKMRMDTDSLPWRELPVFLEQTELLLEKLKAMDYAQLKELWKCNDSIAALNVRRLDEMDLRRNLTPALLAYEGIQYQYMAPGVFTNDEFDYVQEHLRILSGFYGLLRPFDGVTPYRLEMQAKLPVDGKKDMYDFWGETLAKRLFEDTELVIDLASKEYSSCVTKYVPADARVVGCVFGELKDGRIIEKGTMCKMARGEMVRFMAETKATGLDEIRAFDRLAYSYCAERSSEDKLVFLK